jgi:hypothetical protein
VVGPSPSISGLVWGEGVALRRTYYGTGTRKNSVTYTVVSACAAGLFLAQAPSAKAAVPNPPGSALQWYKCNTHTHTGAPPHSDANETPEFVVEWYRSHGYQCLVLTEHEFLTDVAPLNRKFGGDGNFLVLQGQEITQTLVDRSHPYGLRQLHVNGINVDRATMPIGFPDFGRDVSPQAAYERNIAAIYEAGGIPQVNHPNLQWSVRFQDLQPIAQPFLLEIWNAFPTSNNLGGTDDNGAVAASAEELWDALLSSGKIVWAVASDDAHEYHKFDDRESPTPGKAWIVIQAPSLSTSAVMQALRRGQFYASTGITLVSYSADKNGISIRLAQTSDWNPTLKPSARFLTRFIGANGRTLEEVRGTAPQFHFKGDEQYVRASISDSDGRRAWTQPVFLDIRAGLSALQLSNGRSGPGADSGGGQ